MSAGDNVLLLEPLAHETSQRLTGDVVRGPRRPLNDGLASPERTRVAKGTVTNATRQPIREGAPMPTFTDPLLDLANTRWLGVTQIRAVLSTDNLRCKHLG
jgi:hypothetical protein